MFKRQVVYRQFLCMIPINCMFFMIGLERGWIAPILNEATNAYSELPLTVEQCSWMASLGYITRGVSPILLASIIDKVGRNSVIVFNAFVFFGMWIAVYGSRDVLVHYVIRLACGLSDGLQETVAGVYVCENCSPEFRGTFFAVGILFLFIGHCVVFVLAELCSYTCIAVGYAAFGLITLLSTLFLVEPAQYYLMKGNAQKAEANFKRLRAANDPASEKEFQGIRKNIEEEKERTFSLALFRSREVVKSLRLLLLLMFLCAECGYPAMIAFVTKLFSDSIGLSAGSLSMLYGVLQLMSVAASSIMMDRFGRRTLMLVAGASMIFIHTCIVALYWAKSYYNASWSDMMLFSMLTMFSCVYAMFVFPLLGILRGELLPQSVKMIGAGLCTFVHSLGYFVSTRTFLPIAGAFGIEINFVLYACCAVLMTAYAYVDLPETRGKTLVEIQDELKGVEKDAHRATVRDLETNI